MAKSLRSKSKLSHRTVKRRTATSDYAVAEAARLHTLSTRLAEGLKKPKLSELDTFTPSSPTEKEEQDEKEQEQGKQDDSNVVVVEEKKVSTSGPRGTRREGWRKSRGMKNIHRPGATRLNPHKSKNGGKLKRRR